MRFSRVQPFVLAAAVAGLSACNSSLAVENLNSPDRNRVNARPADVEALIRGAFQQVHQGTIGASGTDGLYLQWTVSSLENISLLGNFGFGIRSNFPRPAVDNARGNGTAVGNIRDYRVLSGAAFTAAVGIERLNTSGFTLGNAGRDQRGRAFARFALGAALGSLAMGYEYAGVPVLVQRNGVDSLYNYRTVAQMAVAQLDTALIILADPTTASGFPLPAEWMTNQLSLEQFRAIVRAFRARINSGVARTPAERQARPWTGPTGIIADAEAFAATAFNLSNSQLPYGTGAAAAGDFMLNMNPSTGWDFSYLSSGLYYQDPTWGVTPLFIAGMCDQAGRYETWLAQPLTTRERFAIDCPDQRFPQGLTREAQAAENDANGNPGLTRYFRVRPTADGAQSGINASFYDFVRARRWSLLSNRIGQYPVITRAEMNLLAAEGYIYQNNFATAAQLIDLTRVTRGGLASAAGTTAAPVNGNWSLGGTRAAAGRTSCVPRTPQGPGFTTTACPNLFEILKWEKRLEAMFTNYGGWYTDARGWGDLPLGTPLSWPVPFQDLDARQIDPIDPTFGVTAQAPRGTYGF